jgi:hypothetical protein
MDGGDQRTLERRVAEIAHSRSGEGGNA